MLRVPSGPASARILRQAIYWLEELARSGPGALPAIRDFLAHYEDVEFDVAQFTSVRSNRDLR